jgi:hypothetical protein
MTLFEKDDIDLAYGGQYLSIAREGMLITVLLTFPHAHLHFKKILGTLEEMSKKGLLETYTTRVIREGTFTVYIHYVQNQPVKDELIFLAYFSDYLTENFNQM